MIEQAWWNWFACTSVPWNIDGWRVELNIGEDRLDVFETEFLLVPIKQILIGGGELDLTGGIGNLFYSVYPTVWTIGHEAGWKCHNRIVAGYVPNFQFSLI